MATGSVQMFFGKNLAVEVTPQVVAAGGGWSDHSDGTYSLTARLDENMAEVDVTTNSENIVFGDSGGANAVPFEDDWAIALNEIMTALPMVSSASKGFGKGSVLEKCARTSRYIKVKVFESIAGSAQNAGDLTTATFWGLITKPSGKPYRRTKNVNTINIKRVEIYDTATGAILPNPLLA